MVPDMGRVQISLTAEEDVLWRKVFAKRPDLENLGENDAGKTIFLERCKEIVKT